jgi:hypothetical protein
MSRRITSSRPGRTMIASQTSAKDEAQAPLHARKLISATAYLVSKRSPSRKLSGFVRAA